MTDDPVPAAMSVAVVTGASRGAGRGIAAALRSTGWRVYLTGRTVTDPGDGGIAVRVDHRDDSAVAALFERVGEECGRLDLLVNNAAAIHDDLVDPKPFWNKPLALADVLDVGLRSSYVASWHAAPLMIGQRHGLIAFTSSPGSVCYLHGPPCVSSRRRRNTMTEIDARAWLIAICAHENFSYSDAGLRVAMALLDGASSVEGMPAARFADEVEELVCSGFLDQASATDLGDGWEERALTLRCPEEPIVTLRLPKRFGSKFE